MDKLILSVSPHLRAKTNTAIIMLDVVIALLPALVASGIIFGLRALVLVAVCVATCVVSELVFDLICKKPISIGDFSAVVTGIILAFNLPVSLPVWQAVVGSVFAIVVVKMLFGGLGMNFANPALTGRIFLFLAFGTMSNYGRTAAESVFKVNLEATDLVAGATPLDIMKNGSAGNFELTDLLFGTTGGCIGETCALALLAGFVYLIVRKVITFHIPAVYVGTVFVLSLLVAPTGTGVFEYALNQVLSGGLLLGAIFMATDYVTSPYTKWGKVFFGLGCGLITFAIRQWGAFPEGVSFSILFMNILTPYLTRWTATKPFGGVKAK